MIISFEGIDGSGKSTQAKRLVNRISGRVPELLYVREPGGTEVSEQIRELLLHPAHEIDPFAEMLLFSAARAQLIRQKVRPVHARDGWVICDRFFDSTVAYQGGGRGVADPEWLMGFQREVTGGLVPDRTYLIRLSVEEASTRLAGRLGEAAAADRMEQAGPAFFDRVVTMYDQIAAAESDRFCVIDGSGSIEEIEEAVWADILTLAPDLAS